MICSKCKGQGVVVKVEQGDGSSDDAVMGVIAAGMTLGLSLLVTTRVRERRCPRCSGSGKVGSKW